MNSELAKIQKPKAIIVSSVIVSIGANPVEPIKLQRQRILSDSELKQHALKLVCFTNIFPGYTKQQAFKHVLATLRNINNFKREAIDV